jgi:hypothetical protein
MENDIAAGKHVQKVANDRKKDIMSYEGLFKMASSRQQDDLDTQNHLRP